MSVGTLELLGQSAIVPRHNQMDLGDDKIASQTIWNQRDDAELENAVDAVKDARIVIMNPPFTESGQEWARSFPRKYNRRLSIARPHRRHGKSFLVKVDPDFKNFVTQRFGRTEFSCHWPTTVLPKDSGTF